MAKIQKLYRQNQLIYPATITDAVKDPETGQTIPEILKEREERIYPKMSVGFAENIVGDKSATEEEFSFRPTAGVNRNTLNDGAARIHTLKGNSVVWNQLVDTNTTSVTMTANHIYVTNIGGIITRQSPLSDTPISVDATTDKVTDLTKMFGAGNEPTTVEEFYSLLPKNVDLNAYNNGEIVDANYKAIKTTGFNQWDEQWEVGGFNTSTGNPNLTTNQIRTKNLIPILSGQKYYVKTSAAIWCFFYDKNKKLVPTNIGTSQSGYASMLYNTDFIVPLDVHYIKFYVVNTYGATYKNDICISLYWPTEYGNLYRTYQPYKPFVRDLGDIIAQYFTGGVMRSAGNTRDEFRFNSTTQKWEAVHRVGVVDLGSLEWSIRTTIETGNYSWGAFLSTPSVDTGVIANITCQKYVTSTANDVYLLKDKTIAILSNALGIAVNIYDSMYADSTSLNSLVESLQGVMLNYELAAPIVTEIVEIPSLDYDVADYGTEELVVAEGEQSAPLVADIEYSPNVLAVLKNAPDIANDVDALKSQVAALTEQLAALTATN